MKDRINEAIAIYNETSGKPYKLSAAVGGAVFDFDEDNSDFMSGIDKLMYADKAEYYKTHDRRKRGMGDSDVRETN